MSREVMQMALEALKSVQDHRPNDETNNAINALRAALKEPYCDDCGGTDPECPLKRTEPIPLTDEELGPLSPRYTPEEAIAELHKRTEPEQEPDERPISTVTEAVTTTIIEVEKLLCEKLGKSWKPSGMSIQTLVDELAAQRTEEFVCSTGLCRYRKPLTDEEICHVVRYEAVGTSNLDIARAIERAHGIGGEA